MNEANGLVQLLEKALSGLSAGSEPGVLEVVLALCYSFILNCGIAGVYKWTYRGARYSQDYVHTLIILGTVVTAVIMVVSRNGATAFGMFAAFSIINFRRAVNQSRDIGFIFLAMATGLAVGARAYTLAGVATVLSALMISVISKSDAFAPRRLSHHLRIRIQNDLDYDKAFSSCFGDYLSYHELTSVETVQAGMMTELRYDVTLRENGRLSEFTNRLQLLNGNNRILVTKAGEGY